MPYYYDLLASEKISERGYPRLVDKELSDDEKVRTINTLLNIKQAMKDQRIPEKKFGNLLVASWNLKEFGQSDGRRHPEFYYYIAEILHAFDIIIIQELRRSIKQLRILLNILGEDWSYIINDVTVGSAGNGERSLVLFNTKRVHFNGFSGELFPEHVANVKRTPHITGFMAGWKTFSIVNLHLKAGEDNADIRQEEVAEILSVLNEQLKDGSLGYDNIIIAGDYNFEHEADEASIKLLNDSDFKQIEALKEVDANYGKAIKTYDRFFIKRNKYLKIQTDAQGNEVGGSFSFRELFESEFDTYFDKMKTDYDNDKRTLSPDNRNFFDVHWLPRQMSDHYPIWFEMVTDSSTEYLQSQSDELKAGL